MEFSVLKSDLLKELTFLNGVIEKKNTIPIIQNLLISGDAGAMLDLVGTDLESTLRVSCTAEITAGGTLLLPARRLLDIVRNLPDSVIHFKADASQNVVVTCERSRFKLFSPTAENYPDLPEVPEAQYTVSAAVLRTMIPRTLFAMTQEESRFQLNGAQMIVDGDALRMISTDGHRLSFIEKKGLTFSPKGDAPDSFKVLIPKKTLAEVSKLAAEVGDEGLAFGRDENHIFFKVGPRVFISRMLAGQFPNYEMVLPKNNDKAILFETERLVASLRRVSVVADETTRAVKMHVDEGKVEFTAQSSESGEASETVPVEYAGPKLMITFNVNYLMDFLNAAGATETSFEFKDEITQIQLRPKDDGEFDYRYIVMPMRV